MSYERSPARSFGSGDYLSGVSSPSFSPASSRRSVSGSRHSGASARSRHSGASIASGASGLAGTGQLQPNPRTREEIEDEAQSNAASILCTLSPTQLLQMDWVQRLARAHDVDIHVYHPHEPHKLPSLDAKTTLLVYDGMQRIRGADGTVIRDAPFAFVMMIPRRERITEQNPVLCAFTEGEVDTRNVVHIAASMGIPESHVAQVEVVSFVIHHLAALGKTRFKWCDWRQVYAYVLARMCLGDDTAQVLQQLQAMTPEELTTALFGLALLVAKQSKLGAADLEQSEKLNLRAKWFLKPELFYDTAGRPAAGIAAAPEAGAHAGAGGHLGGLGADGDDGDDGAGGGGGVGDGGSADSVLLLPDNVTTVLDKIVPAGSALDAAAQSADIVYRLMWLNEARVDLAPLAASAWRNTYSEDVLSHGVTSAGGRSPLRGGDTLGSGTFGVSRVVFISNPALPRTGPDAATEVVAASKTLPIWYDQWAWEPCTMLTRTSASQDYIAGRSIGREAVVAAVVTRLVMACASPHFCMTYEMLPHHETGTHGEKFLQVMELVEASMYTLLIKWLVPFHVPGSLTLQPTAVRLQTLNSVVFQVLSALLVARTKANIRHNDMHAGNVLITRARPDLWQYTLPVNGDGVSPATAFETWRVPNMGLCAKIIDFGMATSPALFGADDHLLYARSIDDYIALFHADVDTTQLRMAVTGELQDAVHFLASALSICYVSNTTPAMRERLREGMRQCVRLTRECRNPHMRQGLKQVRVPPNNISQRVHAAASKAAEVQYGDRDHGLFHKFVHWWGATAGYASEPATPVHSTDLPCKGEEGVWDVRRPMAASQRVAPAAVFEGKFFADVPAAPGAIIADELTALSSVPIRPCPSRVDWEAEARRLARLHDLAALAPADNGAV